MNYHIRALSEKLLQLSKNFPVVAVTGARQVGKTSLVKHLFGETSKLITFDPLTDVAGARSDPQLFLDNQPTPLILDEFHYVPELVPVIKRRIDEDRTPGQYILTGSQQWEVMKHLSESLAGRVVFLDLDSFSQDEAQDRFSAESFRPWLLDWLEDPTSLKNRTIATRGSLFEVLWRGQLPDATLLERDLVPTFDEAYTRTYIERDVRLLLTETDLSKFRRFYQLTSCFTSQEINYSEFGRELGMDYKVAQKWLSILKSTYQWYEVPAYFTNLVKRVSKKPKGYFADTGIACMLNAISSPDTIAGHPLFGALFETFVVREIMKQTYLLSPRPNLYHWRKQSSYEVDLVLEYDNSFFPIEVKASSNPTNRDLAGISAFRNAYPNLDIKAGLVVSGGEQTYPLSDSDWVIPWQM